MELCHTKNDRFFYGHIEASIKEFLALDMMLISAGWSSHNFSEAEHAPVGQRLVWSVYHHVQHGFPAPRVGNLHLFSLSLIPSGPFLPHLRIPYARKSNLQVAFGTIYIEDGVVFSSGTKKVTGNIIADGQTTEGFVIAESWINSGYLTAGEVAAIVVGSVVFAFLLVLLVVCLCYNCRYRAVPTMYQM